MVKIGASSLLGFFLVLIADTAMGAYVIRLRNGNEFVTSRYWQEGPQILFDTYGGVFGIDKAFVTKIEASDKPLTPLATIIAEPEVKRLSAPPAGEQEPKQEPAPTPQESEVRRADDPIVGEFNLLKEKSKDVDGMLTSEIRELLNQITAFKNKLAKDSKLFIEYGREFNDTNELGHRVETVLRARAQ